MSKASILIVFLTVLTQLRGQGGGGGTGTGTWGRYGVPIRAISRLGTGPRPLLNAPSKLVNSNESSLGGKETPSIGSFRTMSTNSDVDFDDIINRRQAEMDSMVNGLMAAVSGLSSANSGMLTSPVSTSFSDPTPSTPDPSTTSSFGRWDRRPSFSRTDDSPSPSVTSSSEPPPSKPEPAGIPLVSRWRPLFTSNNNPPSPPPSSYSPPPPSPPPSSYSPPPPSPPSTPSPAPSTPFTPRKFPHIGVSPPQTSNSTPPASCSASNANATPPINQYRKWPSLRRSETKPNNLTVEPNKMEPDPSSSTRTEPPPKPATPSTAPRRFNSSIGNQPSRKFSTSSNTERYNGSTIITDTLPKEGNIEIKISGRQIDDDRMFQMIKEARNAITAIFYGPLHTAVQRGSISYRKAAPSPSPFGDL